MNWITSAPLRRRLSGTESRIFWAYNVDEGRTEKQALTVTERKPKERQHRTVRKKLEKEGLLKKILPEQGRVCKWIATNKYEDVEIRSWICKSMLERIQATFQKMVKYRRDGKDDEARRIGDDILPVLREIKKEDLSFPYSERMHSRLIYPSRVIVVSKTGGPGDQQTNVPNDQSKAWLEWSQKVIEYCKDKL